MNLESLLYTTLSVNTLQQSNNPLYIVCAFILVSIIKQISILVPEGIKWMKTVFEKKYKQKALELVPIQKNMTACIEFKREYKTNFQNNKLMDALIDYICNNNNVKYLLLREFFVFNNKTEVEITKDIYIKLHDIIYESEQIHAIHFQMYSFKLYLKDLRSFCDDILQKYFESQRSILNKEKYYFKSISHGIYTRTRFNTTKSLQNLFGDHIRIAKKRLDLFIHSPEWYKEKGVPYSIGFLLYGLPGCGKTSFIKAIANDTQRHIVNIDLTNETTHKSFYNLFFTDQIMHDRETVNVPIKERIYVIEDADCLTDIVLDRSKQKEKEKNVEKEKEKNFEKEVAKKVKEQNNDELLNLSHLLNILDGVLETPGRIIIMTTNHIEHIDPALKRPGRFDLVLEFSYITKKSIEEMIEHFYHKKVTIDSVFDKVFTPAQIQEGILRNLDNYEAFISFLYNTKPSLL